MRKVEVFCQHPCELGEGPLWHHLRGELLWFDINQNTLFAKKVSSDITPDPSQFKSWKFNSPVSAAGIINRDEVVIAKSNGLYSFHLRNLESLEGEDELSQSNDSSLQLLHPLEADIEENRSNDSRTAPDGSFWVSTMSYLNEVGRSGAGSIYRYRSGRLTKLFSKIAIPNSICFDEIDGKVRCYWSDSKDRRIYYIEVVKEELPLLQEVDRSQVKVFCETRIGAPDGSVIDSEHRLWNAEWGAGKVIAYTLNGNRNGNGKIDDVIEVPVSQPTCPAFCGEKLQQLAITSAFTELSEVEKKDQPMAGMTFITSLDIPGKLEEKIVI